jgi:hypothetical protein
MAITLNAEQERLLSEVVKVGAARSPEEAIDKAVRALHSSVTKAAPFQRQADNLSDLLLNSPFSGANLNLERNQDYARRFDLE